MLRNINIVQICSVCLLVLLYLFFFFFFKHSHGVTLKYVALKQQQFNIIFTCTQCKQVQDYMRMDTGLFNKIRFQDQNTFQSKHFLPLPSHIITQKIYSEQRLPNEVNKNKSITTRVLFSAFL